MSKQHIQRSGVKSVRPGTRAMGPAEHHAQQATGARVVLTSKVVQREVSERKKTGRPRMRHATTVPSVATKQSSDRPPAARAVHQENMALKREGFPKMTRVQTAQSDTRAHKQEWTSLKPAVKARINQS